jgi:hypothetical protein
MNIFGRRRKDSSQPSTSGSSSGVNPISILSATLPKSYRQQQQQNGNGTKKGQKHASDAALPPTPPISPDKENHTAAGGVQVKPRAHHATAPASSAAAGHHQQHYHVGTHDSNGHHNGSMYINELGQMEFSSSSHPPTSPRQPAFMVNGTGAGQQHHQHHSSTLPSQVKHSLPPIPRDPSSSKDLDKKAMPNLKIANRRMSTGSIPSIDVMLASNKAATDSAELQVGTLSAYL